MTTTAKHPIISKIIILFSLAILGCSAPSPTNETSLSSEEVYIDLKQGFSLVIPSAWERERIPVASPRHEPNTVEWRIKNSTGQVATLKIKSSTLKSPEPVVIVKENLIIPREEFIESEHSAGPTLRWEGEYKNQKIIFLIIEGEQQTYLIKGSIEDNEYDHLHSSFEKVLASFSILTD